MISVTVVDVGHGACTVIVADGTIVVDGGPGAHLDDYLASERITHIDAVLVSHADYDHIGGIVELLLNQNISVDSVYVNSDVRQNARAWNNLLVALQLRFGGNPERVIPLVSAVSPIIYNDLEVSILWPHQANMLTGGGNSMAANTYTSANSVSAVLRVSWQNVPIALLAGDMERGALDAFVQQGVDCSAYLLAFPHHGGRPGPSDIKTFVRDLVALVRPSVVSFSIDSEKYHLPRADVIAEILASGMSPRITCTQLSCNCRNALPIAAGAFTSRFYSSGTMRAKCCAGTIRVEFSQGTFAVHPPVADHLNFISNSAPTALCQVQPGSAV